jgi:hypothetical protein
MRLFRKSPDLRASIEMFEQGLRYVQVTLCTVLQRHYSAAMSSESATLLAAQVVNHLKGEDIEVVITNSAEPLKSQIRQIRDSIPQRAKEAMASDRDIREVVVATLRMRTVLEFGLIGESYLHSDEKARIEEQLSVYGPEFPKEIDPNIYLAMARRFRDNTYPG